MNAERASSRTSARSAGIFLILASVPFAMALNRETPALAAGMLSCGILLCLASTEFAGRWRLLPPSLVLAGICSGAAIAIVGLRASPLLRKSDEGATRGNLGALRSELSMRYESAKGRPEDLSSLPAIPLAKTPPFHPDSAAVRVGAVSDDAGGWLFNPKGSDTEEALRVNCTHTDSRGRAWTSY